MPTHRILPKATCPGLIFKPSQFRQQKKFNSVSLGLRVPTAQNQERLGGQYWPAKCNLND